MVNDQMAKYFVLFFTFGAKSFEHDFAGTFNHIWQYAVKFILRCVHYACFGMFTMKVYGVKTTFCCAYSATDTTIFIHY